METKFLSDGRKVVIVGQLNNQETIVQEVFVTAAGDELPGGERFVVKSLHDVPVETYLSKEKSRQEAALSEAKAKIDSINREITDTRNKLSMYRDTLKQVKEFSEHIDEQDLTHFIDVMTGQLNYAVASSYRLPKIERYSEYMSIIENSYGNKRYEGLKLLSVLGNSNGNIALKVNRYSDGSGDNTSVSFFKTYEEAKSFVKSIAIAQLDRNYISVEELQECKRMGIEFNHDEMLVIRTKLHANSDKQLQNLSDNFNKSKEKIEADKAYIEQQINNL
ncbi:Uncharacterised protein [Yersinia enterocolitica]|uniref:hypothetical protein n=1 Tax=Yersinia enterocolitica TaxID=630 RepID=UPI0005E7CA24|nr:hypothetical protein [Yersinia enterocolitica]CQJ13144.1 Uncharacterised protein [Yersinia enterocolitica]